METSHVLSLLEQLDDNLDDLEDVAKPLLDGSVAELSKKLPVLDKAKLYVLVAYAIESLIFCKVPLVEYAGRVLTWTSILTPTWSGRQTASCLPRTGTGKAVLRKDQSTRN